MIINYSDQDIVTGDKSIFLGGPTPRTQDIKSWRIEAIEILKQLKYDGIVYVPEYSTWKPKYDYIDQVEWERLCLKASDVIAFWIPRHLPDMPAFTTNVEFGYWVKSDKVVYGRPNAAEKIKYLDRLYHEECEAYPVDNLNDLMNQSIEKVDRLVLKRKKLNGIVTSYLNEFI